MQLVRILHVENCEVSNSRNCGELGKFPQWECCGNGGLSNWEYCGELWDFPQWSPTVGNLWAIVGFITVDIPVGNMWGTEGFPTVGNLWGIVGFTTVANYGGGGVPLIPNSFLQKNVTWGCT